MIFTRRSKVLDRTEKNIVRNAFEDEILKFTEAKGLLENWAGRPPSDEIA